MAEHQCHWLHHLQAGLKFIALTHYALTRIMPIELKTSLIFKVIPVKSPVLAWKLPYFSACCVPVSVFKPVEIHP